MWWGIIPTIIMLLLIFKVLDYESESNEAYRTIESLKYQIELSRESREQDAESRRKSEKRALRDAFFVMCRAKECEVPEGYTLQEITEKFVDMSSEMGIYEISDIDYRLINSYFDCCIGRIEVLEIPKLEEEIDRIEIKDGWRITTMKNGNVYQRLVSEEQTKLDVIGEHWTAARRFLDEILHEKDWVAREIAEEFYYILERQYRENKKKLERESSNKLIAADLPQAIRLALAKGEWTAKTPETREVYKRCIEMQIELGITDKSEYDSKIALFDALIKKQL